jgi:hypothetical protein
MVKMGSPSKDRNALQHSHKVLSKPSHNPVIHNHVRGFDQKYDNMWEDAMHANKNEPSIHKTHVRSNSDQKELKKDSYTNNKNMERGETIFTLFQ